MKHPFGAFRFDDPQKSELESLIIVKRGLERTISCLEILAPPSDLMRKGGVIGMALYTQALVSYVRCFTTGKRKGLSPVETYVKKPEFLALHAEIKVIRDKHIAHSVDEAEHCNVLVGAKDMSSPAIGLGVRYWFYLGGDEKQLKAFLLMAKYAASKVEKEIGLKGNLVAKKILGSRATWKGAQRAFHNAVSDEAVYGPSKSSEA